MNVAVNEYYLLNQRGMIAYTIAYAYAAVLVAVVVVGSLSSPAYGFSFSTRSPRSIRHISPLLSVATPTDSVTTPIESVQQASAIQTEDTDDPFTLLSTLAATTLLQSDRRRDAIGKDAGAQASSGEKMSSFPCFRNAI